MTGEPAVLLFSEVMHLTQCAIIARCLSPAPPRDTSEEKESLEESVADILALVDDIFFQMKMLETAKHLGIEMKSFVTGDALLAEIEKQPPRLVIVDMNARQSPLEAISALRARDQATPVVAFFSHVQTDVAASARDAGCSEVMPRSKFTKELAAIFSRAKP